jgi:hypothetical protein
VALLNSQAAALIFAAAHDGCELASPSPRGSIDRLSGLALEVIEPSQHDTAHFFPIDHRPMFVLVRSLPGQP